jgi:hypothetical protein
MNKYHVAIHRSFTSTEPSLAFGGATFSRQFALELANTSNSRKDIGGYCCYFVVPAPFAGEV